MAISYPAANDRSHLGRWMPWAAIVGLTVWLLSACLRGGWLWGPGLPISPRREVLPELTVTWMFRQELSQGRVLTEWNPLWFSGFPSLRFISYPVYYAVAGLSLLGNLRLESMMVAFYFVALAGSGVAMYCYLRRLLGDWRAALVGAVLYEAFPFHQMVGSETWIHAAFWAVLPLPFLVAEIAHARKGRLSAAHARVICVALGVCFAVWPVVSSEYTIIAFPFVGVYLLLRELGSGDRWKDRHYWGRLLGWYAVAGVVALGLAAFVLLPGLFETANVGIHAKHGIGTTFGDDLLKEYSVTPGLVRYAIAKRLRLPVGQSGLPGLVAMFWSVSWYPGVVSGALAGIGIVAGRREAPLRAAMVALALACLMATGPHSALNLFSRLPVLGRLTPFRASLLACFFAALLVGYGARWVCARWPATLRPNIIPAILLVLILVDLAPGAAAYQTVPAYWDADERAAYAWLARQQSLAGGDAPTRLWDVASVPQDMYVRTYALSEAANPRYMGYYDNGAPLRTFEQLYWGDRTTSMRLHRVEFVLLRRTEPDAAGLAELLTTASYRVAYERGSAQVWRDAHVGAFAKLYPACVLDTLPSQEDSRQVLPALLSKGMAQVAAGMPAALNRWLPSAARFDYVLTDASSSRVDGLDTPLGERLRGTPHITAGEIAGLSAYEPLDLATTVVRPNPDTITIHVEAPQAGVFTISESWYPHWRSRVDGIERPVLRVNGALLGVWLEAGTHRVDLRFRRPVAEIVGWVVSGITLILVAVTLVTGSKLRRGHS